MGQNRNDAQIKFDLPDALKADCQQAADDLDLSLSQFARASLRYCLGQTLAGRTHWLTPERLQGNV